jgi:threonine dehydratase
MNTSSNATDTSLAARALAASEADFRAAAARIAPHVLKSPLLPFAAGPSRTIALKAENLQPLGSFKIRAAFNTLLQAADAQPLSGVATASAGNFAQGLTQAAVQLGLPITVHLPDTAAQVKRAALAAMGARTVLHPFADWWRILMTRDVGQSDELFVHPVCEASVIVGNGTIGLELPEQWPQIDTVVVPIGGGGLISGIALCLRALGCRARIIGCEIETAAPVAAARAAGRPVPVERKASFVDGIGSSCVLDDMWPLLRTLLDDVIVVSVEEARAALRTLVTKSHVVVEGAGAVALAAAASPACKGRNVVAVLSGGNLDTEVLRQILAHAGQS